MIYSFTHLSASRLEAFAAAGTYSLVSIELAEQPWLLLMCNMSGTDPEAITIGAPVEVTFVDIGDGMALPDFTLAPGAP